MDEAGTHGVAVGELGEDGGHWRCGGSARCPGQAARAGQDSLVMAELEKVRVEVLTAEKVRESIEQERRKRWRPLEHATRAQRNSGVFRRRETQDCRRRLNVSFFARAVCACSALRMEIGTGLWDRRAHGRQRKSEAFLTQPCEARGRLRPQASPLALRRGSLPTVRAR